MEGSELGQGLAHASASSWRLDVAVQVRYFQPQQNSFYTLQESRNYWATLSSNQGNELINPPKEAENKQARRSAQEISIVMAEKHMALDLIEAFAVALKHHLLLPFHEAIARRGIHMWLNSQSPKGLVVQHLCSSHFGRDLFISNSSPAQSKYDPIIPPICVHGTFDLQRAQLSCGSSSARSSSSFVSSSGTIKHRPSLPADQPSARFLCPRAPGLAMANHVLEELLRTPANGTKSGRRSGNKAWADAPAFQDNLSGDSLACILTTPLGFISRGPKDAIAFCKSNRHTVWIHPFLLPFQLVRILPITLYQALPLPYSST
ncbi:hypothetical protein APHAL10511_003601 [Amanita phalloides]|nr:hypothetical protein APHAL10511_003601 [Amanita phalloides]